MWHHIGGSKPAEILSVPPPWPVVGREDHNGVVLDLELLERIEDLPDVIVGFHDLVAVLLDPRFPDELLGRAVWRVAYREREIKEERFAGGVLAFYEVNRFAVSSLSLSARTSGVKGITRSSFPPTDTFDLARFTLYWRRTRARALRRVPRASDGPSRPSPTGVEAIDTSRSRSSTPRSCGECKVTSTTLA